jgi:hypothetical protein
MGARPKRVSLLSEDECFNKSTVVFVSAAAGTVVFVSATAARPRAVQPKNCGLGSAR